MKRTLEEQLGGTRARLRRRRSTIERALFHALEPNPGTGSVFENNTSKMKRCFVELVYREVLICTPKASSKGWPDVPHNALLRLRNGYTWEKVDELLVAADVAGRVSGSSTETALSVLLSAESWRP